MRRIGLVAIALASGCFQELPAPPGGSDGGSTGTSTGTTTTATTTTAATTAMATAGAVTDMTLDMDEGTAALTGGEPASEGLFMCGQVQVCATWDCSAGCPAIDAAGTCVLTALRDRVVDPLTVVRCDGECREHRILARGSGTDEALVQSRTVAGAGYSQVQRCTLKPAEFFAGCLTNYEAGCSDPTAWTEGCGAGEPQCK